MEELLLSAMMARLSLFCGCCTIQDACVLDNVIIMMHNEWQQNPAVWLARKAASVQRIADRFSIISMVDAYEKCWADFVSPE